MSLTFNPHPKGSMGNWNTGTDAASLIKPKKQLAMGHFSSPSKKISGRAGMPRGISQRAITSSGKYKSKAV